MLSCARLLAAPWTVARQVPLSTEFSWSMLPFPSPGALPNPGTGNACLVSPALAGGFFTAEPPGKPFYSEVTITIWQHLILPWAVLPLQGRVVFPAALPRKVLGSCTPWRSQLGPSCVAKLKFSV